MAKIGNDIIAIGVAIIGVATLAVLFSKGAKTTDVINDASKAFSQALAVVVKPVSQ